MAKYDEALTNGQLRRIEEALTSLKAAAEVFHRELNHSYTPDNPHDAGLRVMEHLADRIHEAAGGLGGRLCAAQRRNKS